MHDKQDALPFNFKSYSLTKKQKINFQAKRNSAPVIGSPISITSMKKPLSQLGNRNRIYVKSTGKGSMILSKEDNRT